MQSVTPRPDNLKKRKIVLSRIKRRILKHLWLTRTALAILLISLFCFLVVICGLLVKRVGLFRYSSLIKDFIFAPGAKIAQNYGRTNILILGKGGGNHEAPDLTDTIIFSSISHLKPSIVLVFVPRDIWIPELRAKLNSTYYWGNQKQEGGGLILAKSLLEEIIGQPIHYGIVIDFSGFEGIINALGGIEVEVENSFIDSRYPIPGKENDQCQEDGEFRCRYETIEFKKGVQKMNGATALKFVRSRNAEGDEGTDLARGARQERVIRAIKDKALRVRVLLSPKRLAALRKIVAESVETDIDPSALAILAKRLLQAKKGVENLILSEELLFNPPISSKYDNLYVYLPKDGDWEQVHKWIQTALLN